MILERSMDPAYLANAYLVGDRPGGHAVLVDAGGPTQTILAKIAEQRLTVTHLLCTHHHIDHVQHAALYRSRLGCALCAHPLEAPFLRAVDRELTGGEELTSGELTIRALHVPGHTVGQLAFLIDGVGAFTGDTLFRRTVGGTRGPGHGTFEQLQHSILEVLLELPRPTRVHPGHMDGTTIAEEWEENPFVRLWRGADEVEERPCNVLGQQATLLLRAPDYDGGTKCWVRFEDGQLDVVAGSQVTD